MYHVTFAYRLGSIEGSGLVPGARARTWHRASGGRQGSTKHVHLFDNFMMAVRWAAKMEWDFKKPIIILEINGARDLEADDHVEGQMYGGWHRTKTPVHPSAIVRVIPLTLDLERAFVTAQREGHELNSWEASSASKPLSQREIIRTALGA